MKEFAVILGLKQITKKKKRQFASILMSHSITSAAGNERVAAMATR